MLLLVVVAVGWLMLVASRFAMLLLVTEIVAVGRLTNSLNRKPQISA
jgi:hypothetical protein